MRSSWYILSDSSRVVARVAAASSETIEKSAADAFWAADDIVVERKMAQFRVEKQTGDEFRYGAMEAARTMRRGWVSRWVPTR